MSDNNEKENDGLVHEEEAPVKKSFLKSFPARLILILALASISLGGGLVAAVGIEGVGKYFTGSAEVPEHKQAAEEHDEKQYKILDFDEMIVNIIGYTAAGKKTTRYMKLKLAIVYDLEHGQDLVDRKIFIRDAFQDYLRQVSEAELQGSYGFMMLKKELLKRAKSVAGNNAATEVLISELIIQ